MTGRRVKPHIIRIHSPGPMTHSRRITVMGSSPRTPTHPGGQAHHQAPQPGGSLLGRWSPRSLALGSCQGLCWEGSWRLQENRDFTLKGAHKTSRIESRKAEMVVLYERSPESQPPGETEGTWNSLGTLGLTILGACCIRARAKPQHYQQTPLALRHSPSCWLAGISLQVHLSHTDGPPEGCATHQWMKEARRPHGLTGNCFKETIHLAAGL